MPASKTFNIVWVSANHGSGVDVTATADQVVKYDGSSVAVSANWRLCRSEPVPKSPCRGASPCRRTWKSVGHADLPAVVTKHLRC